VAIAAIITGAGLLVAFLAILVALLGIRFDNRVQGLENLIEGLSGQFASSIAALAAVTIFRHVEKPLCHRPADSPQRLVATIDAVVRRLWAVCLLASVQQGIVAQAAAFRHFSVDLAAKLRQVIGGSRGPLCPWSS